MEKTCEIRGFMRKDGRKGIRNKVLILYTVSCAAPTARGIRACFEKHDDIDVLGSEGCRTNDLMRKKLVGFAVHPNVGAVLVVQNGCEEADGAEIVKAAVASGRLAERILIQEYGSRRATEAGRLIVSHFLQELKHTPTTPVDLSELVFGIECGGSDFTSGLAANRLVGEFTDYITGRGGTVIFEEMYEAMGLKSLLTGRCASHKARQQIAAAYDKFYRHAVETDQFSISPGNIRGGLTTIEEKSMGAVAKIGTAPIEGVLKIAQQPAHPGLWYLDCMADSEENCGFSVSNDASSTLMFLLSGAHMTLLTTGRGHVISNPVGPVIKLTGNPDTYERLKEDIDFNAGVLLTGEKSGPEVLEDFLKLIMETAGGKRCRGEKNGHSEGVLNYEVQFQSGDTNS